MDKKPEDTIIIPVRNFDEVSQGILDIIDCGINCRVRCIDICTGFTVELYYLIYGKLYNNFQDYLDGNSINGPKPLILE